MMAPPPESPPASAGPRCPFPRGVSFLVSEQGRGEGLARATERPCLLSPLALSRSQVWSFTVSSGVGDFSDCFLSALRTLKEPCAQQHWSFVLLVEEVTQAWPLLTYDARVVSVFSRMCMCAHAHTHTLPLLSPGHQYHEPGLHRAWGESSPGREREDKRLWCHQGKPKRGGDAGTPREALETGVQSADLHLVRLTTLWRLPWVLSAV